MLAKFSGLNLKGPYLSLEKEKRNFLCFVHLLRKAGARENRKFHVVVVRGWLKNMQKSVVHVLSCCFTNINLLLFLPFSVVVA